jgi:DNA-binding CsgD family transcriptional regulator
MGLKDPGLVDRGRVADVASPARPLFERADVLSAVDGMTAAVLEGSGRVAVVEGPAGIGKSALLAEVGRRARAHGLSVLTARGSDVESVFAFGGVRQLLEPAVAELAAEERATVFAGVAELARGVVDLWDPVGAEVGAAEPFAVLHGLYWALANLCARGPLLLLVDDAHWLDDRSLLWLGYVARRIEDLPVGLLLAARSTEPEAPRDELEAIKAEPDVRLITLHPLSEAGVGALLGDALGAEPEVGFVHACTHATGGNPFLVVELARSLAADGVPPTADNAPGVLAVRSDAVMRLALVRLAPLSPGARAVARAVAVLGDGAALHHVGALVGLEREASAAAVDELARAGLFEAELPPRFCHPLMMAALERELGAGQRALLHRSAAEVLRADGAASERVAAHLLRSAGDGERWVVDVLRAAAAGALVRGAPEAAVEYLRRALAEPPGRDERAMVESELGAAAALAGMAAAVDHLSNALAALDDPGPRLASARALSAVLFQTGRAPEAARVLRQEIDNTPAGEDRLLLEAELQAVLELGAQASDTAAPDVARLGESPTPAGRCLLATAAFRRTRTATGTAVETAQLAEAALGAGRLVREHGPASLFASQAITVLIFADRFERASEEIASALALARSAGSPFASGQTLWMAALMALRRGQAAEAEMHARSSLELAFRLQEAFANPADPSAVLVGLFSTVAVLIEALIELGRTDEASGELERLGLAAATLPPAPVSSFLLVARARLALERMDPAAALEDALEAGRRAQAWGVANPAMIGWRGLAALAHRQLGAGAEALRLASEEVEVAERFEAPRALGIALRTRALALGGDGLADLVRAATVLEHSGANLEHARALADLGATLRRAGQRAQAREPLTRAVDLASRCGAIAVAERAQAELRATGARPRRLLLSGVEALTAREREVAQLAASGRSNPQIAQALFVTRGTVEKHLESIYRKLAIGSRDQLSSALAAEQR